MRTRPSISGTLRQAGLSIGSDQLKTRPRGVAADHPRLELLGHRSLTAGRDWPAGLLHNLQALNLGAANPEFNASRFATDCTGTSARRAGSPLNSLICAAPVGGHPATCEHAKRQVFARRK